MQTPKIPSGNSVWHRSKNVLLSSRRRRRRRKKLSIGSSVSQSVVSHHRASPIIRPSWRNLTSKTKQNKHVPQRRGAQGRQRQRGRSRVQKREDEQKSRKVPQPQPPKPETAATAAAAATAITTAAEAASLSAADAQGDVATAAGCSWQL